MLAIAAAVVFGIYLLLDLLDVGNTDLFNFPTFASLGLLLLSVLLAAALPAWRVARVDPVIALRDE